MHVYKAITLNPNWVGQKDLTNETSRTPLLTEFPFGRPLTYFGIDPPYTDGIGSYTAIREFNGRRPNDDIILHFMISTDNATGYTRVLQELPHGKVAEIGPLGIEIRLGTLKELGRAVTQWKPFLKEGVKTWVKTAEARFIEIGVDDDLVPATLEGVLGECLVFLLDNFDYFVIEHPFDQQHKEMDAFERLWSLTGSENFETTLEELKNHRAFYRPASDEVVTLWRSLREYCRGLENMEKKKEMSEVELKLIQHRLVSFASDAAIVGMASLEDNRLLE